MVWLLALLFLQDDSTATAPAAANGSALLEMVHNSGPIAFAVLIILLLMSIFSWTIMISKWSRFGRAQTQSQRFLRAFRKSTRLSEIAAVADQFKPSPLVAVFTEIHDEYQRQNGGRGLPRNPVALERAAQTASSESLTAMESRMTWLATIGNIAVFIGLFGTVMGIIDAFHGLGTAGAATLRAVAPGISEALITTAAGPGRRHPGRHRLQPAHGASSRVRRAHGRLRPRVAECNRKCRHDGPHGASAT